MANRNTLCVLELLFLTSAAVAQRYLRSLRSSCGAPISSPSTLPSLRIRINASKLCHSHGVDVQETTDTGGGINVAWIDSDDWMAWDVYLPQEGRYQVSYRIASPDGGGGIQLEAYGGNPVFGRLDGFPRTGGWQNWETVKHFVTLGQGQQTLAVKATAAGWNLNWLEFDLVPQVDGGEPPSNEPPESNCKSSSNVHAISVSTSTLIQGIEFCSMEGIQMGTASSDQRYIGWIDKGDWWAYPIRVLETADYDVAYRVASPDGSGGFQLELYDLHSMGKIGSVISRLNSIPATGDWHNWVTQNAHMTLEQGEHLLVIQATQGGWNLLSFEFRSSQNATKSSNLNPILPVGTEASEQTSITIDSKVVLEQRIINRKFVKTSKKAIIDPNGKNLILRGMGFGGWMLQEPYMMLVANSANNQQSIFRNIQALVGPDRLNQYRVAWLDNWCTEADVKELAASGFNSLRAALHFNLFTLPIEGEPVRGRDTWLQDGFRRLDRLVRWCKSAGLYLILDLHAAPGGQGRNTDINDYDPPKPSLFEDPENIRKFIALWVEIAKRYKDEPWIAGYDLLNEPNWNFEPGHPNGCSDVRNAPLKDLYDRTIEAIRAVDKNHMIIIEGNCWSNNHNGLWPFNDDNVVLSFHRYWIENTVGSIQQFLNWRDQYNVPLWMGESGENSDHWYREAVVLLESQNIGWAWWTWKKMESNSGSYSIRAPDGYYQLVNYWANGGSRPDADFSFNVMMQVAENAKVENAIRNSGSIEALTGHVRRCPADRPIPWIRRVLREIMRILSPTATNDGFVDC